MTAMLTIAVPKGRILTEVLPVMARAGLVPEPGFGDEDDRRLRFATNHADIDLISIATPPMTHAHLAAGALANGKHCVVEVAYVGGSADARVLARLADERKLIGTAAYVLRYVPTLRLVSDLMAQGAIGEPRLMRMDFFSSFMAVPGSDYRWFWEAENGGGMLAGVIAHGFDLARRWFGFEIIQHIGAVRGGDGQ